MPHCINQKPPKQSNKIPEAISFAIIKSPYKQLPVCALADCE